MIIAIVYNSETGYTKKYAEMLSECISLPMFNIEDAKKLLRKGSEIIFMSWVKNGKLQNYNQVSKYFKIKMVAIDGLDNLTDNQKIFFKGQNNIDCNKLYFLKGGIDLGKLSYINRQKLESYTKKLKEKYLKTGNVSTEDYEFVEMCEKGGSYINIKYLKDMVEEFKKENA